MGTLKIMAEASQNMPSLFRIFWDLRPKEIEAMQELRRILRSTNKIGRSLLISVCGVGELVTTFEKVPGWRKGHGIEQLREALDDVAECRGLITRRLSP